MDQSKPPPWGRLYITAVLWFALLLLAFLLPISPGWQKIIALGIILSFFGYLVGWISVYRAALAREDWEKYDHQHTPQRDVPLRPVQAHYLRVMQRDTDQKEKVLPFAPHIRHR